MDETDQRVMEDKPAEPLQYTAQAISPKMRDLMIAEAVPAQLGPQTKYGLGVIVREGTPAGTTWGHSGFFPGYQTELVHVPATA